MPSFIYTFISIAIFFFMFSRIAASSSRRFTDNIKDFWELESKANSTRKADISGLDYLNLSLDILPMKELRDAGLSNLAEQLEAQANKKILNLSMYTNTDLKMMYGPANLITLSDCDEAYTATIRLLNKIGSQLIEANKPEIAANFLSYSVSIGSDISTTYTMLAQIYKDTNATRELDKLIISASTLTTLNKENIINKLNNIKSADK